VIDEELRDFLAVMCMHTQDNTNALEEEIQEGLDVIRHAAAANGELDVTSVVQELPWDDLKGIARRYFVRLENRPC
jgi:hypothetical protein